MVGKALEKAKITLKEIDLVAATAGPGLIGGLLVGLIAGKTIAQVNNIPFIAVNHLEAHALTVRLTDDINFPYLVLLISGGHSDFYIINGINNYVHLDKSARAMGLEFPGGPNLEKLANKGNPFRYDLPRPMKGRKGVDLSFSGLKTAIINIKDKYIKDINENNLSDLAASFQEAVSDILSDRTLRNAWTIDDAELTDGVGE